MSDKAPDFETMSDEEFLNQGEAVETAASNEEPAPQDEPASADEAPAAVEAEAGAEVGEAPTETKVAEPAPLPAGSTLEARLDAAAQAESPDEEEGEGEEKPAAEAAPEPKTEKPAAKADQAEAEGGADGEQEQEEAAAPKTDATAAKEEAPDYEALYKQMMAPFKANGREFAPASVDEAVRLMQMGSNYTKKMQALKPNLKLLRMLENNGLLEEKEISYLIDLKKGDPKAVQKLLHDGKVDPMDVDVSVAPTYEPGDHSVSDSEMSFHEVLAAVTETDTGKETIRIVDSEWDQESKKTIFAQPELLQIIDSQRSNGIYAKITGEVKRRQILGEFGNVPFITAYKTVGDELHAQGKLAPSNGPATQEAPAQQAAPKSTAPDVPAQAAELGTRSTRSRTPAATQDQVRALAAAPGSQGKTATKSFDPLKMSDEEILAMAPPF